MSEYVCVRGYGVLGYVCTVYVCVILYAQVCDLPIEILEDVQCKSTMYYLEALSTEWIYSKHKSTSS